MIASKDIARVLLNNYSLDMDMWDYIEDIPEVYNNLVEDIEGIKNNSKVLFAFLEYLANK